ncbi:UxaA family hydrolase [Vibrio nitrifigilis]|uniref:Altronate dehydratase n=1 Tax=Vibrio nitrifigilis TaxID=2789781 RepID=A0ABS0GMD3_9VIBR|nr:altronate dehydratase family protein [Vibrio nitrifigilis]MBF9003394.1 altronate dehydratase [Vibrio nitrifigilis]
MNRLLQIHPNDNVLVTLAPLHQGEELTFADTHLVIEQDIPQAHKIALHALAIGDEIIKYGAPIGHAIQAIEQGQHVDHTNIKTNLSSVSDYQYAPAFFSEHVQVMDRHVQLYRRGNGDVGIRNELWIIPTVGCVNALAQQMKRQIERELPNGSIDGVHVFTHQFGCSQLGQDHLNTRTLLQNLVKHPNAGGVLVVGLGCENNQITTFKETLGDFDPQRVRFMTCQHHDDEVAFGVQQLRELAEVMQQDQRSDGMLSEVRFGLECGGSDGFSGITANPLLGRFSDYVISHGGTSVLTEVPEMFGAEHLLMARCENQKIFEQTVQMINNFKQYFIDHHQPIYENPSPGNKAGGISTLEEKSLGCTQKSGHSPVCNVLQYGERLTLTGLSLLSAPGNDAVATSALAMAGCHIVLFTTGRGTPYGGPVPTFKVATNTSLAQRKPHWIDFNAGQLVEGSTMEDMLEALIDNIALVVNGQQTCNEYNDFREIAVFKSGVTL